MKARMYGLVGVALIAVLSGTPVFAAVCAGMCELDAPSTPASASRCSRHAGQAPSTDHVSRDVVAAPAGATLSHEPACCRRSTAVVAVLTKSLRVGGVIRTASAPAGPALPGVAPPAALRLLPAGASGPPAPPRSPLVLRI